MQLVSRRAGVKPPTGRQAVLFSYRQAVNRQAAFVSRMKDVGRVALLSLAAACASTSSVASTVAPLPEGAPVIALDTTAWVDSTLNSLPLRQRVAQMVMIWMLGDYTSVDDSTFAQVVSWVQQEGIGGITMSLGTPIEVADKLNYLQRRARVPLLVSSDLEPGLMRLETAIFPHYLLETGGGTSFPPQMAIAATGRDEDAYAVGRAMAREARGVGIQLNFAPVVDVNINPN